MTLDVKLLAALDAVVLEIQSLSKEELHRQLAISQQSIFAQTIDEMMLICEDHMVLDENMILSKNLTLSSLKPLFSWKLLTSIAMTEYHFDSSNDYEYSVAA